MIFAAQAKEFHPKTYERNLFIMKKFRIVALLLVMCLASSCFVGGTFAKYASETSTTDSAAIAKWSIDIGGKDMVTEAITVNLFNTVCHTDTNDNDGAVKDAEGNNDPIIAPGTRGEVTITVTNTSDVKVSVSCTDFSIKTGPAIPLTFTGADTLTLMPGGTGNFTLTWAWAFGNDASDTTFGTNAAAGTDTIVTAEVQLTATQLDT